MSETVKICKLSEIPKRLIEDIKASIEVGDIDEFSLRIRSPTLYPA